MKFFVLLQKDIIVGELEVKVKIRGKGDADSHLGTFVPSNSPTKFIFNAILISTVVFFRKKRIKKLLESITAIKHEKNVAIVKKDPRKNIKNYSFVFNNFLLPREY